MPSTWFGWWRRRVDCVVSETVVWATPYQLRNMFMTVSAYCDIGNVRVVFGMYWRFMADDIVYRLHRALGNQVCNIDDVTLQSNLLKELSDMFCNNGLSLSTCKLPMPSNSIGDYTINRLVMEELSYDRCEIDVQVEYMCCMLNDEHQAIYESIIHRIASSKPCVCFGSRHGGTGKHSCGT